MKCIICDEILDIFTKESYLDLPVNYCKNCNLYINGDSKEEVNEKVSNMYKENYWNERNSETSINSEYTDVDSQGKRRNWVSQFSYTKPYINGNNLLEIGVGAGQSIFWFEEEGFDVYGIEPDGRNVNMINKKLKKGKVIESSVENFSSDEFYDIIWMSHVLEHLIEPIDFLRKIKNNLKKNSILFIEVPNCQHKPTLKSSIENNPHLFHFTKESLSHMVKDVGYQIISCDVFRPATKSEGMKQKIFKNLYKFYPRIMTDVHSGRDLRIILKNS